MRLKSPAFGPERLAPVRCVGSVPEFKKVRVEVFDCPTSTFWKFIGLGDSDRRGLSPVPDRVTWSGLLGALLRMLSAAARAPDADGVKVTELVHVPPVGTSPHPDGDAEKSPGLLPVTETLLTCRSPFPRLAMVTVWAA